MGKKPITKEEIQARKEEIMEQCFECYADHGFHGTGVKALQNIADALPQICIPILKM